MIGQTYWPHVATHALSKRAMRLKSDGIPVRLVIATTLTIVTNYTLSRKRIAFSTINLAFRLLSLCCNRAHSAATRGTQHRDKECRTRFARQGTTSPPAPSMEIGSGEIARLLSGEMKRRSWPSAQTKTLRRQV